VIIRDRMIELIKKGASLQVLLPDTPMVTFILAGVLWRTRPIRLRWCAIFPEHQGHIHETPYNKVRLINKGRDIAFYRDEEIVLYVAPYEESGLDLGPVIETFADWQQQLRRFNNEEQFAEFLETA